MKIRFTRSVAHKAQHIERGSVSDLPEKEALIFLRAGDAVISEEPAKPAAPRESAAFHPPAENAALPPATKKPRPK